MSDRRRLPDLVADVGKILGRSREDIKPFLALLQDNWYDSVSSLRDTVVADLTDLGLPQRFAKELLNAAQQDKQSEDMQEPRGGSDRDNRRDRDHRKGDSKGKSSRSSRDDARDESCFNCGGNHYARDCPKAKGGKGKGKSRDCFECGGDHLARDCPKTRDRGDRGGGGGGGGVNGNRPSEKEYAHTHKITFDHENLDPKFPMCSRIIGKAGRNVQHIHQTTGAWVWCRGRGSGFDSGPGCDDPLHVVVQSDDKESLDEAIGITNDLVDTVLEQYAEWVSGGRGGEEDDDRDKQDGACFQCGGDHFIRECPEKGRSKGKGKGKGKSKGKGKGKGKRRDRDEDREGPASKRSRI